MFHCRKYNRFQMKAGMPATMKHIRSLAELKAHIAELEKSLGNALRFPLHALVVHVAAKRRSATLAGLSETCASLSERYASLRETYTGLSETHASLSERYASLSDTYTGSSETYASLRMYVSLSETYVSLSET
jgi:hypothetical protein